MNDKLCIYGEEFTPYREAVKSILSGTPVPNLEEIRTSCNDKYFMRSAADIEKDRKSGYFPALIVASFTAHAENKILQGANPKEVYEVFPDPEQNRARCVSILENIAREF